MNMKMNIELKKIKYMDRLSRETPCFSAEIYEDGKFVAYVTNDGHGGGNMLRPAKGVDYKEIEHLDNLSVESEIFEIVEEYNLVTKNQSKNFIIKKDDELYTVKFKYPISQIKKYTAVRKWFEDVKEHWIKKGYEILNRNL